MWKRGPELAQKILKGEEVQELPGLGYVDSSGEDRYSPPSKDYLNLDDIPFPAYELLPLNYWSLKYSHGPFEGKKISTLTNFKRLSLSLQILCYPRNQ